MVGVSNVVQGLHPAQFILFYFRIGFRDAPFTINRVKVTARQVCPKCGIQKGVGELLMNTRFRRPLQAVALLFSLTLFIGYLWLTQRQSGLPSIEAFPLANDSHPESLVVITMATNPDGAKRPVVLGTKSMGGTPVVRINLTPEEQIEHAEMLKPFLTSPTVQNTAEHITIKPPSGSEFDDYMDGKVRLPEGKASPMFMPGSKSISQPVFSTRKVAQPVNPSAHAPLMPSSKLGIFAPPILSFDPSIHNRSLMSGSKSGRVYNFFSTLWHNSPSSPNTITSGSPTDQIHLIQPASPLPGAVSSGALELPTP
jgi:hypothetical protein